MLTSKVAGELNEVVAQFLVSLICVDHSNTRSLCRPGAISGLKQNFTSGCAVPAVLLHAQVKQGIVSSR